MNVKKKSQKNRWFTIGIIVIVIAGAITALAIRPKTTNYESVAAKTGDITTYYSFSGNVETKNRQRVVAEKMMQISTINFQEGDTVKEGDVLMKTSAGEKIKSKIDGIVTNVNVEENAQVMAGVQLLEVVDNNNLEIAVKVDEYNITALTIGKKTTVKIGAINNEITGTVKSMSEEGQTVNGVTYFIAKIDLAKDKNVKIGMSAEVKLVNQKATGIVTLPMTAIQFDENNNPYVLIEDDKGTAVKNEIKTGINDGNTVEVKSGVFSGAAVLYTKATSTTNGMGFGGGANANANGSTTNGGGN